VTTTDAVRPSGLWMRSRTTWLVVSVVGAAMCGLVGLVVLAEVLLLTRTPPTTPRGRAWRLLGLTTLTTGLVVELLGTVTFVVLGDRTGAALVWAFFLGGLALVPGLLAGALVGCALAVDGYRRDRAQR
jgi:hypothetical protein